MTTLTALTTLTGRTGLRALTAPRETKAIEEREGVSSCGREIL